MVAPKKETLREAEEEYETVMVDLNGKRAELQKVVCLDLGCREFEVEFEFNFGSITWLISNSLPKGYALCRWPPLYTLGNHGTPQGHLGALGTLQVRILIFFRDFGPTDAFFC